MKSINAKLEDLMDNMLYNGSMPIPIGIKSDMWRGDYTLYDGLQIFDLVDDTLMFELGEI